MLALVMGAAYKVARTFLTRFHAGARASGMNLNYTAPSRRGRGPEGAAGGGDGAAKSSSTRLSTTSVRPDGVRNIGMWAEA
jgi:hypothetical protein